MVFSWKVHKYKSTVRIVKCLSGRCILKTLMEIIRFLSMILFTQAGPYPEDQVEIKGQYTPQITILCSSFNRRNYM